MIFGTVSSNQFDARLSVRAAVSAFMTLALFQPTHVEATKSSPIDYITDTRVFMPYDCVFALPHSERSAIGAALIGGAFKIGLNRLGASLRAAGSEKTFTTIRSANIDFNQIRPPACIYVVQGNFITDGIKHVNEVTQLKNDASDCTPSWASTFAKMGAGLRSTEDSDFCTARRLADSGIYLSDEPGFFFEGKVQASVDGSALQIEASALHLKSHLDKSLKREGGALVLSFALGEPGAGAPGADNLSSLASVTQLPLGRLRAPVSLFFTGNSGPVAPWLSIDRLNENSTPSPRIVWAARSETRDSRELLLFFADLVEDSKATVTSELEQTFLKSERRKAELTALSEESAAVAAAEKSWADAEIALGEYRDFVQGTPKPSLNKRRERAVAVRALQRAANVLAITAGRQPHYSQLVEIPRI